MQNTEHGNVTEIDLGKIWKSLWSQRKLVTVLLLVTFSVSILAALVWPKSYEAYGTLFPISNSSGSSSLSEYAGLASLAGISLPANLSGGSTATKTVTALLDSRTLMEIVAKDLRVVERLEVAGKTDEERMRLAVETLKKSMKVKEDPKTGVISVAVELEDANIAQEVTNQIFKVLESLLEEKSLTANRKNLMNLTKQISEQSQKLSDRQKKMAEFQRETSLLNPATQAGKAVDTFTLLIQQKMELELQLATAMASYSLENPRVTLLKYQLSGVEKQIETVKNQVGGDLPSLKMAPDNLIRYQNLARDLEIATKIYTGLFASMEQSRLESDKDIVYIEVLDEAELPIRGNPSRTLVFVATMALGVLLSLTTVLVIGFFRESRANH